MQLFELSSHQIYNNKTVLLLGKDKGVVCELIHFGIINWR